MCNSHNPPQEITDVHEHHWTCPTDNNGCGKHLQCGPPYSNEPDGHEMQVTCEHAGCNEQNVRQCTHDCPYKEPTYCARKKCGKIVSDPYEHYITCGTQDPSSAPSCGQDFWSCVQTIYNRHKPRSCDKRVRDDGGTYSDCPVYLRNCKHIKGYHTVSWETWHHSND